MGKTKIFITSKIAWFQQEAIHIVLLIINIFVLVYIISGIIKLINPFELINTLGYLSNEILRTNIQKQILLIFSLIIGCWEILLAFLFLIRARTQMLLWILLLTNLTFTAFSHYLEHKNKLSSCGCFGSLSSKLYPFHFIYLYSFSILLLAGVILISMKKRILQMDIKR
jgi:hypothetical protein